MAGRISDEDVAEVRNRARIEEVVGQVVALRNAGGGSLKGLCPFHDEKTPSFQVTPSKGFYYCFGCGEGGDVLSFLMKHDNLSFTEAVENLADRVGVQLRYLDGPGAPRTEPGLRTRILEANAAAAEFFSGQLAGSDALAGRQFLAQRGFDRAAAEHFGIGWAPRGGKELQRFLQNKGFSRADLVKAGLARESGWDFFQGRLLWPIRDSSKQVVGFGARRIFDDDRMPAKYLNTPETPVYKKSHVLYGLDLARKQIGQKSQAVVVEGYTDVMAAHLAGVDTAVASCGTAFGEDHARTLQRLMGGDAFAGEIIFTFDGDAAGQAAALKVFNFDQKFISQTYVAIEPTGLDPCDLRLDHGEAAVRELVARRVPLYRFVMSNVLSRFDLDRADGRLGALRAAAPLVSSIRDTSLVSGYARELAGMIGMDVDEVRRELARAARRGGAPEEDAAPQPQPARERSGGMPWPDPRDRRLVVERDIAKLLLQQPELFGADWQQITSDDFTHPAYAAVLTACRSVAEAGPRGGDDWAQRVQAASGDAELGQLVVALSVEQLLHTADEAYVAAYVAKLRLLTVNRRIADLKSRLQRTNPVEQQPSYNQMFAELLSLEADRKTLQVRTLGATD
ncbi:DNA primase [Propionibacteriaceae bacterium ES.041]|uniref:DNA primase n=1 Tax=Enemella evansiae TaxID=2016499 RepID=UPI000B97109A|nr:DNA primase [Enemella evansiae]OYN93790.1 DNA primase [Enemella evansiae]PFG66641.1 DNA primase [Propionibacteriaceae bacterium ES.041]